VAFSSSWSLRTLSGNNLDDAPLLYRNVHPSFLTASQLFDSLPAAIKSDATYVNNLVVYGDVCLARNSNFRVFSDRRLKEVVGDFTPGADTLQRILPVVFQYNGKGGTPADGKLHVGVVAQELNEIDELREFCIGRMEVQLQPTDEAKTSIFVVDLSCLQFVLVNAMKQQLKDHADLKKSIDDLTRNRIRKLERRFEEAAGGCERLHYALLLIGKAPVERFQVRYEVLQGVDGPLLSATTWNRDGSIGVFEQMDPIMFRDTILPFYQYFNQPDAAGEKAQEILADGSYTQRTKRLQQLHYCFPCLAGATEEDAVQRKMLFGSQAEVLKEAACRAALSPSDALARYNGALSKLLARFTFMGRVVDVKEQFIPLELVAKEHQADTLTVEQEEHWCRDNFVGGGSKKQHKSDKAEQTRTLLVKELLEDRRGEQFGRMPIVIAPAGYGKSSMLRHMALEIAQSNVADELVVWLRADCMDKLASECSAAFGLKIDFLVDAAIRSLTTLPGVQITHCELRRTGELLTRLLQADAFGTTRLLLLVDAFDEVPYL